MKKSRARPPSALEERLRELADAVRKMAREVFVHRGEGKGLGRACNRRCLEPVTTRGRLGYRIRSNYLLVDFVMERQGSDREAVQGSAPLEETVPVQRIWLDAAEKPEAHAAAFENEPSAKVVEVLEELFKALLADGGAAGSAEGADHDAPVRAVLEGRQRTGNETALSRHSAKSAREEHGMSAEYDSAWTIAQVLIKGQVQQGIALTREVIASKVDMALLMDPALKNQVDRDRLVRETRVAGHATSGSSATSLDEQRDHTPWLHLRRKSEHSSGSSGTATSAATCAKRWACAAPRQVNGWWETLADRARKTESGRRGPWDRRGMVRRSGPVGQDGQLHGPDLQGGRRRLQDHHRPGGHAQQPAQPDAAAARRGLPRVSTRSTSAGDGHEARSASGEIDADPRDPPELR